MIDPFFSVCIPVYNGEKYISESIESVLSQSFSDYEVIVINDGSTDSTQRILDLYSSRDTRIKVFKQDNRGSFNTRLDAINKSTGKYIVWLDADDYLKEEALEFAYDNIIKSGADIVIYNNYIRYDNGYVLSEKPVFNDEKIWISENKSEIIKCFFCNKGLNAIWKKIIKKDLYYTENTQKDIIYKIMMGDDWLLSFFPMIHSKKILYTPKKLIYYRVYESSMTAYYDYSFCKTIEVIYTLKKQYIHEHKGVMSDEELDIQYLVGISKAIAYIPGRVTNKNAFYEMMNEVRNRPSLFQLYAEYDSKLDFLYRLPIILLRKRCYYIIYLIKQLSSKRRKIVMARRRNREYREMMYRNR